MSDPLAEYEAKQLAFAQRIAETESYIRFYKRKSGLAKHQAAKKVREARVVLDNLIKMKEDDSLPWEEGHPTYPMDDLSTLMLAELR